MANRRFSLSVLALSVSTFGGGAALAQTGAQGPDWCTQARTNVEKSICGTSSLWPLEADLAVAYQALLKADPLARQDQNAFIRERNAKCNPLAGDKLVACITERDQERLAVIRKALPPQAASLPSAPPAVTPPSSPAVPADTKPSWCDHAKAGTEQVICDSPKLSALDVQLNTAYKGKIASLGNDALLTSALDEQQTRWIETRNKSQDETMLLALYCDRLRAFGVQPVADAGPVRPSATVVTVQTARTQPLERRMSI